MKVLVFACVLLAALQYGQSGAVPRYNTTEKEMSLKLDPVACGSIVIREVKRRFPKILSVCIEDAKDDPSDSLPAPLCVALGVAEKIVSVLQRAPECAPRQALVEQREVSLPRLNPVSCGLVLVYKVIARIPETVSLCAEQAQGPGGAASVPLCVVMGVAERLAAVLRRPECL